MTVARWSSSWTLVLLFFLCTTPWHLFHPPELPALLLKVISSTFYTRFQSNFSVQPDKFSSHLAHLRAHWDNLLLWPQNFLLEKCPAFLWDCLHQPPKQAKVFCWAPFSSENQNLVSFHDCLRSSHDPTVLLCSQTAVPGGHLPLLGFSRPLSESSLPHKNILDCLLCCIVFPGDIW